MSSLYNTFSYTIVEPISPIQTIRDNKNRQRNLPKLLLLPSLLDENRLDSDNMLLHFFHNAFNIRHLPERRPRRLDASFLQYSHYVTTIPRDGTLWQSASNSRTLRACLRTDLLGHQPIFINYHCSCCQLRSYAE